MIHPKPTSPQPSLDDLLARYLRQAEGARSSQGEVLPHEAGLIQPVQPAAAWQGAIEAMRIYGPLAHPPALSAPPGWAEVIALPSPGIAIPFCLGNYPQMVRDLAPFLTEEPPARPAPAEAADIDPALQRWAAGSPQRGCFDTLLAAGVLRSAGRFDVAEELLGVARAIASPEQRAACANESATLAWHRGQPEQASADWQRMTANPAVLFNRGMAALVLGQERSAREALSEAIRDLPESSAWHHLAQLYRAIAPESA